ncbi:hypothetical protein [Pseudohoeflea coraliihabitans]|uniref:Uncharacterized protein n=1 Tax=Pseudohoeflea coraliihabitans TaxID=2860393 RepID=A0ABS6WIK2_9HYPH|nr:hypothetical protein [Pseudohoeflea sp. DP4N28-3]MBW3095782.1 hypothetical protein [Pseudohoeflea sp. DP4N28-3]
MIRVLLSLMVLAVSGGGAFAATFTNKDSETQVIVVTEDGTPREVTIDAGQSVDICPAGCFVTMPLGDRETFLGSESVDILGGVAVID